MDKRSYSRRVFIGKCLGVSMLTAGGALISSCNNSESNKKEQEEISDRGNCDDLSNVSESELKKREMLSYVKVSIVPGAQCGNCANYLWPLPGRKCGGCVLFAGPVRFAGYCIQYRPIGQ